MIFATPEAPLRGIMRPGLAGLPKPADDVAVGIEQAHARRIDGRQIFLASCFAEQGRGRENGFVRGLLIVQDGRRIMV
jgi:hypothetical protein